MSALDDLIAQVGDPALRGRLEAEARRVLSGKKFGLVFEDHLPDNTLLPGVPIRRGGLAARRGDAGGGLLRVLRVAGGKALCVAEGAAGAAAGTGRPSRCEAVEIPVGELVAAARPGEAVYPFLEEMGRVERGGEEAPWHALIEADNAHALQYLQYVCGGKVDCIYVDPPYNTGARDWKYNNDYVDQNDSWRHSKWLSMMKRRLKLAKKLLNPKDSVLIVTIDEKEYLHLGCLLEEMFPEARIQMVSSVINPGGVTRSGEFGRTDEYLFFVKFGQSAPSPLKLGPEWMGSVKNTSKNNVHYDSLLRTGTNNMRSDRPNLFYPIFVSEDGKRFMGAGTPLVLTASRETVSPPEGCRVIFPIHSDGSEGCWQIARETLLELQQQHFVRLGGFTSRGMALSYLKAGQQRKVARGEYAIHGLREDNSYILDDSEYKPAFVPGTQWAIPSHDASRHGSGILRKIFADKVFSFPKSLYAVHDAIRFFVAGKPNALIVDFFAGSGTTLHAVNLLNAEDGGRRRCVMVTNNEVSEAEAKEMRARGLQPGDEDWEALGIARHVTWPRTVCSIEGHDVRGVPLKGEYLGSGRKMGEGFKANAAFFRLSFLDKDSVALGKALEALLTTLWMKSGAKGRPPGGDGSTGTEDGVMVFGENRFAVLTDERGMGRLQETAGEGWTAFLATDDGGAFRAMAAELGPEVRCVQLYRDYLENFRINRERE